MNQNILISTSTFGAVDPAPLHKLKTQGFRVTLNPHGRKLTPEESIELMANVHGLIAGTEKLNAEVLASAPNLKAISRVGTGMDNIDMDAAEARGIIISNTPDAHVDAVAELTLAAMLNLLRHTGQADRALRRGDWHRPMGRLLKNKTIGLIGLGRVGKRLLELLNPFNTEILAFDPVVDDNTARTQQVQYVELNSLLQRADIISLHRPGTADGAPVIGAQQLALMQPDAMLINCARGGLIDETALAHHLRRHPNAGACLDTYANEPYQGELTQLENALLTAHIGGYAAEARLAMEQQAVDNLINGLNRA